MPACQYSKSGEKCSIETDTDKDTYCYVHRCIVEKKEIKDKKLFDSFLHANKQAFHFKDYEKTKVKIGFSFNIKNFYSVLRKTKYDESFVNIENVIFFRDADFSNYRLESAFNIVNCIFKKKVTFKDTVFQKERYITGPGAMGRNKKIDVYHSFNNVQFCNMVDFKNVKLNNVEFKDLDLSKCVFFGTIFNNCKFTNIIWATKSSWLLWIGKINKRKAVLLDELNLKRKDQKYIVKLSDLERIYRSLKALSKSAEDRDMEGEFNYSENEMIRKRNGVFKQLFTSKFWYFVGSRYGERPFYAFLNIFILIALFSVVFFLTGIKVLNEDIICRYNWKLALSHALSPLTFNKWQITAPSGLSTLFLTIFEGSLLAIQIGLFVNALRRKLQR